MKIDKYTQKVTAWVVELNNLDYIYDIDNLVIILNSLSLKNNMVIV